MDGYFNNNHTSITPSDEKLSSEKKTPEILVKENLSVRLCNLLLVTFVCHDLTTLLPYTAMNFNDS